MRQQSINGLRSVHAGFCHAWPLPADATCAAVARQVFKDAVSEVGLEPDLLDDCILMTSELAANTLHARAVAGTGGGGIGSCPSPRTWEESRLHPPARHRKADHPDGRRQEWGYADLVEAAEHTVHRYSELELILDLAAAEA
jgi:hypothetical protein